MPCFKTTATWAKNLRTNTLQGQEFKQFTVQLTRDVGCCSEKYHIFVNGEEIEHHSLSYNPCSPLCCSGGSYEWEQEGHSFLLMYNNLSFTRAWAGFRLFIDGVDANTDRDFKAFWRRRGMQILFLGVCFVLVGIVLSLVFRFAIDNGHGPHWIGYGLFVTGLIYIVIGFIPILRKYNLPRYVMHTDVSYAGQNSATENIV